MRILYGIVGEGMGHATRSRVVLEHLLTSGHEVLVVVSGRAHRFLKERFAHSRGIEIKEIHGLQMVLEENALELGPSIWKNAEEMPAGLKKNIEVYRDVVGDFKAQVVISDFESWAYLYGRRHDLPVISIDNMQIINRCSHPREITAGQRRHFKLAKLFVKAKLPGAYHYLVTSFFYPRVRKKRTTLVPPILRPEILRAQRHLGEHVLVYQTSSNNSGLVPLLKRLPGRFRVYGMGREGTEGNVTLKPFSEKGFIDDLRTAKAVIAGGGYSLLAEAVHLHVPVFSVPIEGQFEQMLNARYLQRLGYGAMAEQLTAEGVEAFLSQIPSYQDALEAFDNQKHAVTFSCLDELLGDIALDEPPKDVLLTQAMGAYDPYPLPEDEETIGLSVEGGAVVEP